MKKNNRLKKAGALMMSALLAMAMVTTASAAEERQAAVVKTGKLAIQGTVEAPKVGAKFAVYPVATFDAEKPADSESYVYTNIKVSEEFKALVEAEEFDGAKGWEAISKYASNGTANVPSSQIAAFAAKLEASGSKPGGTPYTIGDGVIGLPYGYYLAVETDPGTDKASLKSSPILVAIPDTSGNESVTVTVKSSSADIDKKIVENNTPVSHNGAAVGDKVSYQVSSDVPLYGAEVSNENITYKITDSLSKGLTYNDDLKLYLVTGDKKVLIYSSVENTSVFTGEILNTVSDGDRTAITIDLSGKMGTEVEGTAIRYYPQNGKTQIVAEYSAVLNEHAVMGDVGNENGVTLTYDADHTTEIKAVKTYSTSLKIIKKEKGADGATTEKLLAGAKFKLQKEVAGENGENSYVDLIQDDGTVYELETGDNGEIVFNGLDEGTYKLIETKAPGGYSLDATERIFTLALKDDNAVIKWEGLGAADNMTIEAVPDAEGTFQSTIYNVKGITLPGTGGSGTTMFKIVGAGLMVLACVMLLVYYKKKGKTD